MAKVYKMELYISDPNGDYDLNYIKDLLSDYFLINIFNSKETKEFEWEDELKIKYGGCNSGRL